MGDQPSPSQSPTRASVLWRVQHSPMTSGVAMLLFLVPAALWLLAVSSAQVRQTSGPAGETGPSLTPLHIWFVVGIIGAVLALGSLSSGRVDPRRAARTRDAGRWRHRPLGVAVVACVGRNRGVPPAPRRHRSRTRHRSVL